MMASSLPTPEDPAYADRRLHPRVPVALPAFLQAKGERHAVQLLDLSAGGAKLSSSVDLPIGTAVTLVCGTLSRAAVVRWGGAGILGLSFESELEPHDISALIERSRTLEARIKTRD
jgi:hypothetical protein